MTVQAHWSSCSEWSTCTAAVNLAAPTVAVRRTYCYRVHRSCRDCATTRACSCRYPQAQDSKPAIAQMRYLCCAQPLSMPKPRGTRGRAPRESIDSGERSAILTGAMAVMQVARQMDCGSRAPHTPLHASLIGRHVHAQNTVYVVVHTPRRSAAQGHATCTCLRHASRGVNDPHGTGAGPPRAREAGVVHTTAWSPSSTPWLRDGRHRAPPWVWLRAVQLLRPSARGRR